MKSKSLISAILPTFNRYGLLEQRIEEIINQTYDKWELIIINDASTDDTIKVLNKYKSKKIKVINLEENSGCVSIPRAIGICNSDGEYIAPLDDDVGNHNQKFEILVNTIEKKPQNVLAYGERIEIWRRNDLPDNISEWQKDSNNNLFKTSYLPNWDPLKPFGWGVDNGQILYKRSVYEKIPIKFPKRACDWELAKMIKNLGDFQYVNKIISAYYWHHENRSLDQKTKIKKIYPEKYIKYFNKYNVDYIINE